MKLVFVYGTLKRGQRNDHYLSDAEFIGHFTTGRRYTMYDFGGYPAVCLRGRDAIEGEVYRLGKRSFSKLDELEWYPRFYQRIEIMTRYGRAWMYIVRPKLCRRRKRLPAGSWP